LRRLAAACLLALAPALLAAEEKVVPTVMCGDYFLIPLEVDLDRDGKPTTLQAIFDTGGGGLHIDPDSVRRAGGGDVRGRRQLTVRNATAGPLTFGKLRPTIRDLDHLARIIGTEIDIFLPHRAFENLLLTLDFAAGEMRVAEGTLPRADGKTIFNSKGPSRRPFLNVEIQGRLHRLLIDSGSSGSVSLRPGRELDWAAGPLPIAVSQGMEGLRFADVGRIAGSLRIGGVEVRQPIVRVRKGTELFGTQIMRHYVWTFDQQHHRVKIEPNDPAAALQLPPWRGTGAVLEPAEGAFDVGLVLEGSPADRAGVRRGDRVVAVNGKPVSEPRTCERWDEQRQDERRRWTLERGGARIEVELEAVDLIP
jgi:hypothetical protein